MKRISYFVTAFLLCGALAKAQTYSPIAVSGFNIDAIAESSPNSQAQTTQSLDWSNHVMYSANFAAGAGFACGGVLNSGTIVSGSYTYQLQAFNANNSVYIANGTTRTITLTTPAQYSRISLLIFSTEGTSTINTTFNYSGGTTTNFGSSVISDWFFAGGAVYVGFGRATRVTAGSTADGCTADPRFYPLDFSLSCADEQKNLQSITISCTAGNQGAYVMAVSGQAFTQTNTVTPIVNPLCNGGTGSATASITGTNSPFTYSWNSTPVQTTATASNLPAGSYTCTVTDSKGCVTTTTVTITQPPVLTLTLTPANASCGTNNGSISATGGGGTPTYSYNINGGAFGASSSFSGLGAGTYTVGIKDNNGCQTTGTVSISASASPSITVNSGTICNGGSMVLTANGGTTYTWAPAGSLSSPNGATVTASPGATTVYTVTGATGGCSGTATSTVTVVSTPTLVVNSATMCVNSNATLNASGAATYTWSPATGLSGTTGSSVTANPATTTVYTINGTAGTCSATTTATVTVNNLPTVAVNSATICATQQTATLTANGANTYSWANATGLNTTSGTSVNATPGATTVYTVTGADVNSCTNTATATVTVNTPPNLILTNGVICNGTSVTLTASGANTYTWSPAGSLSSATGSNVTASPASTTQYTVIATDANGCTDTDTTSVTVVSNPTITVTSATVCAGNSATLNANGATTYTWMPGGTNGSSLSATPGATQTYTISGNVSTCTAVATATITVNALPVVAVNSATICAGQQTATLTANGATNYSWLPATGLSSTSGSSVNATPGSSTVYTITGTDANNCTSTATSTVIVNTIPTVSVNSALICSGGSTTLNANGAATYTWSPGTGLSTTNGSSVTANPTSTTVYTISGTNANSCTNTAVATVTVVSNPSISVNNASICAGQQTATLTASGATSYNWSPATALSSTSGNSVNANPNTTTSYTIVGTVGTCTAQTTCTVSVNPLPAVTASSTLICNGQSTSVTAGGASTYTWSTMQQGTTINVSPSSTTNYSVAGTDGNGCINAAVGTVTVSPLPNVIVNSAALCAGNTATLTANGATAYTWSPATGLSSAVGTSVGANPASSTSYTVTGTDNNGCANTAISNVTVNALPNVTATSTIVCQGKSGGIAASGANTYNWSPATGLSSASSAGPTASPNATTVYTVTGTDVNGCKNSATATVTVNLLPLVTIAPATASGCAPLCVNFSNVATNTATVNYTWNFGNGTTSNSQQMQSCYANAGTYTTSLTLVDNAGCTNTGTASVNVYPVPQPAFTNNAQNATILDGNVQFTDESTNGVIGNWTWNFGDGDSSHAQNPQHLYTDTGSYYVQLSVTSNYGCTASVMQEIHISPEYMIYIPNAFSPNGDNTNDVFLPKGEGISRYALMIFDRWGNLIFQTNRLEDGWDGTKGDQVLQQDVYAWKIELRNFKGEPRHLSGVVSLLK